MPLIYAFVARGTCILAEQTSFHGNFAALAAECLQKLSAADAPDRHTVTCDRHTFNFLRTAVEGVPYTFLVVADEAFGRQVPFAFLERVSQDFASRHGAKAATAPAGSYNRTFGPQLKQHMDYCSNHPDEISKVAAVQKRVDEVRNVMVDNIESVLARGERIQLLVDRTEELAVNAEQFRKQGRAVRTRMWWGNFRVKVLIAFLVALLVVVIFLLACFAGGHNCTKRRQ